MMKFPNKERKMNRVNIDGHDSTQYQLNAKAKKGGKRGKKVNVEKTEFT